MRRRVRLAAVTLTVDDLRDAAQKSPVSYDREDAHYDTISAFIKSMRGSDPDAAVYYLASMIAGGEDPRFIARRMIVFASEDVGNADPRALEVAVAASRAVEWVGLPECRITLSQAATYLAIAPKSNAAYKAIDAALDDVRRQGNLAPPPHLRDANYRGAKQLGHGEGYEYPHSHGGWVEQQYLPDELSGRRYYVPIRGVERKMAARLEEDKRRAAGADALSEREWSMSNLAVVIVLFVVVALVALAGGVVVRQQGQARTGRFLRRSWPARAASSSCALRASSSCARSAPSPSS